MLTNLSLIAQCVLIVLLITKFEALVPVQNKKSEYSWVELEEWSTCSTSCGLGTQQKTMICIQRLLYTETVVSNDHCKSAQRPEESVRSCNHGACGTIYYWRPSKWSDCSQTCGNSGRKTRDVDCVYDEGDGTLVTSSFHNCDDGLRPEASSLCNNFDCPPKFIPGKWGNCVKSRGCLPGKQRRSLDCIGLLKSGKTKKMPRNACYKETVPPVSWRKCFDHINTKECLKSNKQLPVIDTKQNTMVQMRKTKKLKIQIGQIAYVFLHTKIVLNCPVNYFVSRDIVWKHNANTYKFDGDKTSRIKVDKKGRLRIPKFKSEDQGSWVCIAGASNATTIIKFRNPSVGYQDWVLRTALWNREMLNEDPQVGLVRQEVVQWIKKSWSECSLSCGGEGVQQREVHCEEIDSRHYIILGDDVCEKRGQKKPETKRKCLRASQCPKWFLREHDADKCTDNCIQIGMAQTEGKLSCIYQEKEINANACDLDKKPPIECPNKDCQVTWKKSNWSKCSLSCGGTGIRARYLMCIWNNTGQSAGSLCYKENLFVPKVIKPCVAPKCYLKCIDLSPNCRRQRKFCKLSLYKYTCCNTCKQEYAQTKLKTEIFSGQNQSNNKTITKIIATSPKNRKSNKENKRFSQP